MRTRTWIDKEITLYLLYNFLIRVSVRVRDTRYAEDVY